jgi:hypothetical protein
MVLKNRSLRARLVKAADMALLTWPAKTVNKPVPVVRLLISNDRKLVIGRIGPQPVLLE